MIKYNADTYTGDFETTSYEQYLKDGHTRVWLWDLCSVKKLTHFNGTSIGSFFEHLDKNKRTKTVFFHNQKFDGRFIIDYLFKCGYTHNINEQKLGIKQFSSLISGLGVFFSIKVNTGKCLIEFYDSSLKIPLKVKKIPKAYGFSDVITKGEIDFNLYRPVDYKPTDEEIDYCRRDTEIVARAIKILFEDGNMSMTLSSDSLASYKKEFTYWPEVFPLLPFHLDQVLRESYKGGWVYLKRGLENEVINGGISYDVNSLFPSVMIKYSLPYGMPVIYTGEYIYDEEYPLYIQQVEVNCTLKKNHLPTVLVKSKNMFRVDHASEDYLYTTDDDYVNLTLTNVDLELLKEHYDIHDIIYDRGFKFKGSKLLFKDYILGLNEIKERSEGGARTIAKGKMNTLYGKHGTNPRSNKKIAQMVIMDPYDDSKNYVSYTDSEEEIIESVYVPVASFITAYARRITISAAQLNYDRFIYADTDSIHLKGKEELTNIETDDRKIGFWKNEGVFDKARFVQAKTYIKIKGTELEVKAAGLPKNAITEGYVNFENFKKNGLNLWGVGLKTMTVPGGCVLKPTDFTL